MSEKLTTASLDTVFESTETDWARLAAMTDEDIELAIADDPDWAAFNDLADHQKRAGFMVTTGVDEKWRLLLRNASGVVVAQGTQEFSSKAEAVAAVDALFQAIAKAA